METKINLAYECKKYTIYSFDIYDKDFYLINKENDAILYYNNTDNCIDVTNKFINLYDKNEGKEPYERQIGCKLVDILYSRNSFLCYTNVIMTSDSAKEIAEKIVELRENNYNYKILSNKKIICNIKCDKECMSIFDML